MKELYANEFTYTSDKNWRSKKQRFPLVLQDIIAEVTRPVLKKNNVPFKDFVDRMKKRFSSTNAKKKESIDSVASQGQEAQSSRKRPQSAPQSDQSQTQKRKTPVSHRTQTQSNPCAKGGATTAGNVAGAKKKAQTVSTPVRRPRSPTHSPVHRPLGTCNEDLCDEGEGQNSSNEDEVIPRAKRVRTPGTQAASSESEQDETEERQRSRASVQAYVRKKLMEQSQEDREYTPADNESEELEFSSEAY